ncbi:hypothetical protein NDU88_003253 [Pleurodeles waltl]|uniref:Uncharacterized protein n=1 Tax=Pleurodeles waltl TaxID=8319 RepID=A0AAV7QB84_PLEWA|nr:hypothetical protein NDU88_003253 [Pleurodeles waltl]
MAPGGGAPAGPTGPLAFNLVPAPYKPTPFMPFCLAGDSSQAPLPTVQPSMSRERPLMLVLEVMGPRGRMSASDAGAFSMALMDPSAASVDPENLS